MKQEKQSEDEIPKDNRIIVRQYSDDCLDGVIDAYIDSFAGPPWFEDWNAEQVEKIVLQARDQRGFLGKVALYGPDQLVIGVSLGYMVPCEDTETVKYSSIYKMLKEIGWQDSFCGAETFIKQAYQQKGAGKLMLSEFAKEPICERVVFRTKNLNMIKLREKVWQCQVKELFYDPVEKERMWYGVQKDVSIPQYK
ncbi:MAG: hypothetical protein ABIA62_05940 [Candidatus Woesearchaeota archaeon]